MTQDSPRLVKNNFDLLRFLFAGIVCLVHAYELSGYQELEIIVNVLSSSVAVNAFFIVSGFLVFMSFERSSSIYSYANKRFRRVYPAYFTVVMVCAFGFLAISTESITGYFSADWFKYVFANLLFLNFLQPAPSDVFNNNIFQAVNGALWTLKIEVLFYLSVPLFVFLFNRLGRLKVIIGIYILSVGYVALCSWLAERTGLNIYLKLGRQLPGQLSYFIAGAFFYYYLPTFERRVDYFLLCSVAMLAASLYWQIPLFEPFALATVVLFFALFIYLGNFGKYGDFSYGIYILHFPIIQCFIHFGWFSNAPWFFLLSVVLATLIAAIAMWHLVEKRFLSSKSHYVSVTTSKSTADNVIQPTAKASTD